MEEVKTLRVIDYASNQEVKWCPGCGDYAVLNTVKKTMAQLQLPKENTTFISGIGCSSRFPYYMDTYGFHTIHGRAAAIATGVKIANPNLDVWMISGDGDSLAIGGNHFIHAIRRNIDITLLLFNNEIYGLTKGQYSPTSKLGKITGSSPHGTIEEPFSTGELAIGAKSKFFARVVDTKLKQMVSTFVEAQKHKGFSVVEILQNCNIFNDKTHAAITDKVNREENQLWLEHGKPMLFGKENNKGLRLSGLELEVVTIGENNISENDILIHDAQTESSTLHLLLAQMQLPKYPVALGVIRNVEAATYNDNLVEQRQAETAQSKFKTLDDLFLSGNTFEVG